jgi:ketosteroid isomerase-like protein
MDPISHAFKKAPFFILFLLFLVSQSHSQDSTLIKQIIAIEKQSETELNAQGVAYAFEKFADADAVIKRQNDTLIKGSKAIGKFYSGDFFKNARAFWKPDFVDISNDGTMAYSYGRYRWEITDGSGKLIELRGVFHTVWKRQKDGSWKYVWD